MNKLTTLLATAALLATQIVTAAPTLSATITHESIEHGADGVTRTTRFEEHFIRDGDNVWVERALPTWAQGEAFEHKEEVDHDHHELDTHVVPRWIRPGTNGEANLVLIDAHSKTTYSAGPESYQGLGFSGRWTSESSLINSAGLKKMQLSSRASTSKGAVWYEQKDSKDYTRILWNEALQFPLAIETGSINSRYTSRTTVRIDDSNKALNRPWLQTRNYTAREMSDLGD